MALPQALNCLVDYLDAYQPATSLSVCEAECVGITHIKKMPLAKPESESILP